MAIFQDDNIKLVKPGDELYFDKPVKTNEHAKDNDRLLKESDVLNIAFQLPLVVNSAFYDAVKALPSALVRCKNCRHRIVNGHYGEKGYMKLKAMCELDTGDIFQLGRHAEDDEWYCADGERKDDGDISRIDKVKNVIKDRYGDAMCGLYFTRNFVGDPMSTIWEEDGVTIDICYNYEYFEVFGLTDEEENKLSAFYNSLRLESR